MVEDTLLTHTGYKVYRDGAVIAELPANASSFEDSNVSDGTHRYTVTALFGERESAPCEELTIVIENTGITDIVTDGDANAEYFNTQGIRVEQPSAPGIYIRRNGNSAVKVAK